MPQIVGSIGLVLDIIGVVLLFRYGLPENLNREGTIIHTISLTEAVPDPDGIKQVRHYYRMGRLGLVLLIVGFLLQLIGNLTQLPCMRAAVGLTT